MTMTELGLLNGCPHYLRPTKCIERPSVWHPGGTPWQGVCPLSVAAFNASQVPLIHKKQKEYLQMGVLTYADDIVLRSHSLAELEVTHSIVSEFTHSASIQINPEKTRSGPPVESPGRYHLLAPAWSWCVRSGYWECRAATEQFESVKEALMTLTCLVTQQSSSWSASARSDCKQQLLQRLPSPSVCSKWLRRGDNGCWVS